MRKVVDRLFKKLIRNAKDLLHPPTSTKHEQPKEKIGNLDIQGTNRKWPVNPAVQ